MFKENFYGPWRNVVVGLEMFGVKTGVEGCAFTLGFDEYTQIYFPRLLLLVTLFFAEIARMTGGCRSLVEAVYASVRLKATMRHCTHVEHSTSKTPSTATLL